MSQLVGPTEKGYRLGASVCAAKSSDGVVSVTDSICLRAGSSQFVVPSSWLCVCWTVVYLRVESSGGFLSSGKSSQRIGPSRTCEVGSGVALTFGLGRPSGWGCTVTE